MSALSEEFIRFSLDCGVLRFGEFVTKADADRLISSMQGCSMMGIH